MKTACLFAIFLVLLVVYILSVYRPEGNTKEAKREKIMLRLSALVLLLPLCLAMPQRKRVIPFEEEETNYLEHSSDGFQGRMSIRLERFPDQRFGARGEADDSLLLREPSLKAPRGLWVGGANDESYALAAAAPTDEDEVYKTEY
ncbi:hypothetical protein ACOMHN_056450 [Nucella lapillus]